MRGMYTAGVLDVFMEHDLYTDATIGVSAGAVFGCNYKSRQIGRTIRYNCRYSRDPRFEGFRSLLATGDFYNVDFCYRQIPETLDPFDTAAYAANPMEFYAVATDVETGEPVYTLCPDGGPADIEWMRASASMPVFSRPVEIGGRLYLDGGVSDPVPLKKARELGFDRIVVILTREKGFRYEKGASLPFRVALRRFPKIRDLMLARSELYNGLMDFLDAQEGAPDVLILRPSVAPALSRIERDPAKLRALYEAGRSDGQNYLPLVLDHLRPKQGRGEEFS